MRLLLLIVFHFVASKATLNVHDKMYTQLDAVSPCIVRLNGTQSFGCTSSRNGNVGIIHIAQNVSDLNWVIKSALMDAYVVGLPLSMFNFQNLQKLNSSDNIKGVLLMHKSGQKVGPFSPEDTCPNRYSGLAGPLTRKTTCNDGVPWNPITVYSSISMYKWQIPIFFTDHAETIDQVNSCFRKFNLPVDTQLDRALCALKMSAHMYASVDSTTCIRRSSMMYNINPVRYCDPLGDDNIFAPALPFRRYESGKDYIVVATRLDSTSLFYGLAPGSLSTATSLVTLLLTANLLFEWTRKVNPKKVKKNVLFVLFNGEAYDYIGSSRVAYDMEKGQFPFSERPIRKDDISLFVELSQLNNNKTVTYHTYKKLDQNVTSFIDTFETFSKQSNLTVDLNRSTSEFVPPSSFQSFLAMKENMSGFIFASYDKQFVNEHYHSLFDNQENLGYKYADRGPVADDSLPAFVANFSTVLAQTLFHEMTGEKVKSISARSRYGKADELLHCYIDRMDCSYFANANFDVNVLEGSKLDYYVGVNLIRSHVTRLTKFAFVYLTATKTNATSREECFSNSKASVFTYVWVGKICLESTVNISDAVSPAFIIPEYDLANGTYSSWTESSWQLIDVRMFLKPSSKYEWLVFMIGIVVMMASFVTLFWIKHNARELFNYPHLITASNL